MAETKVGESGAPPDGSGAPSTQTDDSSANTKPNPTGKTDETPGGAGGSPRMVSWENHQRVLDDMHKEKTRRKELETTLGDVESEKLRAKEDFKGLADKYKAEAEAAKGEYDKLNVAVIRQNKFQEVQKHALKDGLRSEAISDLELLDFKGVEVDVSARGHITVKGAKEFADSLKQSRPHWYKTDGPPIINGGGGGTPPGDSKVTENDIMKIDRDYAAGRISEQDRNAAYAKYDAGKAQSQTQT